MKKETLYEWTIETLDEPNGDILDSDFAQQLTDISREDFNDPLHDVGVVRDVFIDGRLDSRLWAYIKDGKLPEYFSDAAIVTRIKVPVKFHKELESYLKQ